MFCRLIKDQSSPSKKFSISALANFTFAYEHDVARGCASVCPATAVLSVENTDVLAAISPSRTPERRRSCDILKGQFTPRGVQVDIQPSQIGHSAAGRARRDRKSERLKQTPANQVAYPACVEVSGSLPCSPRTR